MYLLNKRIAIIIVPMLLYACKPQGALTPEDAFMMLRKAYQQNDSSAIERLLSRKSRDRIAGIITLISRMDEAQKKALALRFNVPAERLRILTIRDFISLELLLGKRTGEDNLAEVTRFDIIGKDMKGARATLRVENGMELVFVKEGPYWKLDLEKF